jgi:hypothetical protein
VVVRPPDSIQRLVAARQQTPEQPSAAYVQPLLDARGPIHNRADVSLPLGLSGFRPD